MSRITDIQEHRISFHDHLKRLSDTEQVSLCVIDICNHIREDSDYVGLYRDGASLSSFYPAFEY